MTSLPLPAKRAVRQSFGRSAPTYDEYAFLQREIGGRLFERLDYIKLVPQRILDIGSGTGNATQRLRERYENADITALDIAPVMLAVARNKTARPALLKRLFGGAPLQSYVCADAETLPFAGESFELALSNLAMQWCDPERIAKETVRVLKPKGLFMFTTFGPDTLKELRAAFKSIDDGPHVNTFPDMHDIGDILVHAGFADPVMDQEIITLTYTDLMPLLRELKGIGAHNVLLGRANGLMGKHRWRRMVDAYERFRKEGRLPATYEVVYGHAWKPEIGKRKTIDGQQKIDLSEFKRMVGEGRHES